MHFALKKIVLNMYIIKNLYQDVFIIYYLFTDTQTKSNRQS